MLKYKVFLQSLGMILVFACFAGQARAQLSFKMVEKERKKEEKARQKLAKEKAKKNPNAKSAEAPLNSNNQWLDERGKNKDNDKALPTTARGQARGKKHKANIPKAAQGLSKQRGETSANTKKYRENGKGLTKSAKAQRKKAKRKKGSEIEVW